MSHLSAEEEKWFQRVEFRYEDLKRELESPPESLKSKRSKNSDASRNYDKAERESEEAMSNLRRYRDSGEYDELIVGAACVGSACGGITGFLTGLAIGGPFGALAGAIIGAVGGGLIGATVGALLCLALSTFEKLHNAWCGMYGRALTA